MRSVEKVLFLIVVATVTPEVVSLVVVMRPGQLSRSGVTRARSAP